MKIQSGSCTIDCIHKLHWVNQGLVDCEIGRDPSKCDTCPAKKPKEIQYVMTSTSTEKPIYANM